MIIYALRHGETEGNVAHIVQSHTDGILTEAGRVQAAAAGGQLTRTRLDAIYCSDLGRCVQTVDIVTGGQRHYGISRKLREWDAGDYEGGKWEDLPWFGKPIGYVSDDIRNGETWPMFRDRIIDCLNGLYAFQPEATVLLVTHGGVVRAINTLLDNDTTPESHISNAGWKRFEMSQPIGTV